MPLVGVLTGSLVVVVGPSLGLGVTCPDTWPLIVGIRDTGAPRTTACAVIGEPELVLEAPAETSMGDPATFGGDLGEGDDVTPPGNG